MSGALRAVAALHAVARPAQSSERAPAGAFCCAGLNAGLRAAYSNGEGEDEERKFMRAIVWPR